MKFEIGTGVHLKGKTATQRDIFEVHGNNVDHWYNIRFSSECRYMNGLDVHRVTNVTATIVVIANWSNRDTTLHICSSWGVKSVSEIPNPVFGVDEKPHEDSKNGYHVAQLVALSRGVEKNEFIRSMRFGRKKSLISRWIVRNFSGGAAAIAVE